MTDLLLKHNKVVSNDSEREGVIY